MTNPEFYVTMATVGLAGLAMVTVATLAGWRGWLSLKAQEIAAFNHAAAAGHEPIGGTAGARIEIADLRERIRKLEAIAAGVDL